MQRLLFEEVTATFKNPIKTYGIVSLSNNATGHQEKTHYANMPMQNTANFDCCKHENFQFHVFFFLFLLKT